jgi:hypothetical protein
MSLGLYGMLYIYRTLNKICSQNEIHKYIGLIKVHIISCSRCMRAAKRCEQKTACKYYTAKKPSVENQGIYIGQ